MQSLLNILMKLVVIGLIWMSITACNESSSANENSTNDGDSSGSDYGAYAVVATGQRACYDDIGETDCPAAGEAFYGQDAQHSGNQPDYADHGDGTVTDNVTGLMWQQAFTLVEWADGPEDAATATTGGYTDWRVPTIKELYSLINFNGNQGFRRTNTPRCPGERCSVHRYGLFRF